jgi:hypothetical protein
MKRIVEEMDRGQSTLFPECLEDWICEDRRRSCFRTSAPPPRDSSLARRPYTARQRLSGLRDSCAKEFAFARQRLNAVRDARATRERPEAF